jgi:hypothetical protein
MNATPVTTIPTKKDRYAAPSFRVTDTTTREMHQPIRDAAPIPAIGITRVSVYARTLAARFTHASASAS